MTADYVSGRLIVGMNVTEYFADSVASALHHQQVEAEEETAFYLVNLLSYFTRARHLFSGSQGAAIFPPLAAMYAQALDANTLVERKNSFKRLGDVALITSGLFAGSFSNRAVDIDYYIAMGGGAYGCLSDLSAQATNNRYFYSIFAELSAKFQIFVDVLAEVGESSHVGSQSDILRLYEIWLRTGSKRAAAHLRSLGIEPCGASISKRQN